jgi:hypothetical protein
MSTILRIEHPVPDYERWKAAFDADPIGRDRMGVRRHRIMRPVGDEGRVMIDLEFDSADEADRMLGELRTLWSRVEGTVMTSPEAHVVEEVETATY